MVGPELSAVYPFVLNFGVSGEVEVNGVADPALIRPSGVVNFERGDVNLVATQVRLSREHPNRAVFVPEHGLDPTLDVSLVGARPPRARSRARRRNWTDNLVVTSGSGSSRSGAASVQAVGAGGTVGGKAVGGVGTGRRQPSSARASARRRRRRGGAHLRRAARGVPPRAGRPARVLATSRRPRSRRSCRRSRPGGQLGKARWRVTTAPSIPGLLVPGPRARIPFRNISQFSLGVRLGAHARRLGLQATMSRKLTESEMQTTFALVYKLTDKLRTCSSTPSRPPRRACSFEFTTNARGK